MEFMGFPIPELGLAVCEFLMDKRSGDFYLAGTWMGCLQFGTMEEVLE